MSNLPGPTRNNPAAQIKCGHCHGYHNGQRGVFFCQNGPHAIANRARAAQASRTPEPTPMPEPVPQPVNTWRFSVPQVMVENLKDGRYAVRREQGDPFTFIRVSRPKNGKRKGCLVVQTQHSDWYQDLVTIFPSGKAWFNQQSEKLDMALFIACADPMTAAINYGRELGRCSRCGRELTDERSRYYSIGPECEKYWPEIISHINEEQGEWYLGIK